MHDERIESGQRGEDAVWLEAGAEHCGREAQGFQRHSVKFNTAVKLTHAR
jgi:hypothetical protein